jgi:predicted RNase H-like HicB family nuclease
MNNNLKYEITIYWSETDELYIAEVPELAGCMADGETYDEALKNAQIVINQWIETANLLKRTVPKAKKSF